MPMIGPLARIFCDVDTPDLGRALALAQAA